VQAVANGRQTVEVEIDEQVLNGGQLSHGQRAQRLGGDGLAIS
jgi:hypothetical protein